MNNSNQAGILIIMAIFIGVFVYVFMFFGSEMGNQNLSSNYGQLSPSSFKNLFSNNNLVVEHYNNEGNKLDIYGSNLNEYKSQKTSGADVQIPNVNSASIVKRANVSSSTSSSASYEVQSKAFAIANTNNPHFSNAQGGSKTGINPLLIVDTRTASGGAFSLTNSKGANLAVASKTAYTTSSTNLQDKKIQKVDGDPNEPGAGGTLPVGDGVWIMLGMLGVYGLFCANKHNSLAKLIGSMR